MEKDKKYWFRPMRFWNWFAFYYPSSRHGWLATVLLAAIFIKIFVIIDWYSYSGSDSLLAFSPWAVAIFLIFDLLCFRFGEYPSWWRKK